VVFENTRTIVCLLTIVTLTGSCSAIDGSVSQRVNTINKTIEDARNESVLLNIVRASYSHPLNFVTVSKVGGAGTIDLHSQLPTVTFGSSSSGIPYLIQNSIDASASGNFDVNILDSKEFFKGLLTPVNVMEIDLLIRQGFPRELLFYTLVEAIRVTHGKTTYEYRNDPFDDHWTGAGGDDYCRELAEQPRRYQSNLDPPYIAAVWTGRHKRDCNFQKFKYFVQLALRYGLTSDVSSQGGTAKKPETFARFCFDPAIANQRATQNRLFPSAICGVPVRAGGRKLEFMFPGNVKLGFEVKTRSAFGLYRYLGYLLRSGAMETVTIKGSDGAVQGFYGEQRLLTIERNTDLNCFAAVTYAGTRFCVPLNNSDYTKLIFSLLTQLSALNTTPSDLPVTPTVRITP